MRFLCALPITGKARHSRDLCAVRTIGLRYARRPVRPDPEEPRAARRSLRPDPEEPCAARRSLRPHPEEPCAARRLEGWHLAPPRSRATLRPWPSFETAASRPPQDE